MQDWNAWRVLACLTPCRPVSLPKDVDPTAPDFAARAGAFARASEVRYIVTFDSRQPWPVWHVRPGGPEEGGAAGRFWQLYEYSAQDDAVRPVPVPPAADWPTKIPEDWRAGPRPR